MKQQRKATASTKVARRKSKSLVSSQIATAS